MSTPQEWYMSVPPVTRAWLTVAVLSSFGARFGLVNPFALMAFNIATVFEKFQIWRLLLNFGFFGRLSFNWLIQMVMLSRYGAALEDNPYPSGGGSYRGNTADFTYMLVFGGTLLLAFATFLEWYSGTAIGFLATSLHFMVIYVWSKRNPETEVSLYMFRFKGAYLPWALIVFSIIFGDDPTLDLLGLFVGHLYYFLVDALPNSPGAMAGRKWLWTPNFMYSLFGQAPTHAPSAFVGRGAAPVVGAPPRVFFQGQGRRLND